MEEEDESRGWNESEGPQAELVVNDGVVEAGKIAGLGGAIACDDGLGTLSSAA